MQKEASTGDQELTLKKRARRRLVGAIALVLLMVTVLPMLLKDRSQQPAEEQVKINLPGEVAVTDPAPVAAPEVPADFDSTVKPSDSVANNTDEPVSPPVHANTPAHDSEAAPAPTPATSESAQQTTPAPTAKPEDNKKFYVQVGVFSDTANVKRLQAKLNELGYKSTTEKVTTPAGQKIRLKTQVFTDRNEAAIALHNIKDAGLTGMVVSQ